MRDISHQFLASYCVGDSPRMVDLSLHRGGDSDHDLCGAHQGCEASHSSAHPCLFIPVDPDPTFYFEMSGS